MILFNRNFKFWVQIPPFHPKVQALYCHLFCAFMFICFCLMKCHVTLSWFEMIVRCFCIWWYLFLKFSFIILDSSLCVNNWCKFFSFDGVIFQSDYQSTLWNIYCKIEKSSLQWEDVNKIRCSFINKLQNNV